MVATAPQEVVVDDVFFPKNCKPRKNLNLYTVRRDGGHLHAMHGGQVAVPLHAC